jgi:uncharacterized membrane protein YbhN (UPF0104 family)
METFHLLSFLLLLLIIELFSSILAFVFEEREPLSLVVIVLMQRIIYRPIITFAVLRALWFLLRRKKNDWNKLDRSPTVKTRTDAST